MAGADWLTSNEAGSGPPSLDRFSAPVDKSVASERPVKESDTLLDLIDLSPWGSGMTVSLSRLATEIVLYGDDIRRFAQSYSLTVHSYQKLRKECSALAKEVEAVERSMQGRDRMTARFRDLASNSLGVLASILNDPGNEPGVRLKAFELAARYGGIEPAKSEGEGQTNNIQFVIKGAPQGFGIGAEVIDHAEEAQKRDAAEKSLVERANKLERDRRMGEIDRVSMVDSDDDDEEFPSDE